MTDSPGFKAPIDPKEQPILDKLLLVRDNLLLLKQDKTQYVKSQDVTNHYHQVIEQVHALNELRSSKKEEQNRLDNVLDDCLQLISLFFLTIGRNAEAPAAYSITSTIRRLLDHLKEAGFYTGKDLHSIENELNKIQDSVNRGTESNNHSQHMLTLLETRVANCRVTLEELKQTLSGLSPELTPVHEKLVSILRSLSGLNVKPKFPTQEVKEFQKQLKEIEAGFEGNVHVLKDDTTDSKEEQYINTMRHMSYDKNAHLEGKDLVLTLLERCLLWAEISLERRGKFDETFKDVFNELLTIRNQLDKLALTQAWSLRETDLYGYQRKLDRFDEERVDGNFVGPNGKPAELYEQRALLYLLRKSYANIYFMITASEPVSEALLPIYNQLMTLRKCLVEVKRSGGVSSPRELYPYSMKLNSIDNMRNDGKFIINGDIPEGQGSVTDLLAECFDLAYDLRNDAEEESDKEAGGDAHDEHHGPGTKALGEEGHSQMTPDSIIQANQSRSGALALATASDT